jgi:general secretion pathway protein K
MPPNRSLRTVDELNMVAGMNEDFYKLLAPKITIFGTKGVNINYTDKQTLMSLDPSMTEEAVNKVIERRSNEKLGGPFKNDKDFFDFIRGYGVNTRAIEESKVPLLYDIEYNFRIISTGLAANVKREITVITYDFDNLVGRYAELLKKAECENPTNGAPPPQCGDTTGQSPAAEQKIKGAKGRPSVVYWEEN